MRAFLFNQLIVPLSARFRAVGVATAGTIKIAAVCVVAAAFGLSPQAPTFAQKANQPEVNKVDEKKATKPEVKVEWGKLSADQQMALAPVQKSWADMGAAQQKRMVSAAKDYAKMQPIQKERFQTRLRDWAALTPEQRKVARAKYETLSKLPPAKQYEIHEKWQDKQAAKAAAPVAPPPATPSGAGAIKP